MVRCKKTHNEYEVTNAIFTFVTIGEDTKSINVRSVVREDISDEIRELLKSK